MSFDEDAYVEKLKEMSGEELQRKVEKTFKAFKDDYSGSGFYSILLNNIYKKKTSHFKIADIFNKRLESKRANNRFLANYFTPLEAKKRREAHPKYVFDHVKDLIETKVPARLNNEYFQDHFAFKIFPLDIFVGNFKSPIIPFPTQEAVDEFEEIYPGHGKIVKTLIKRTKYFAAGIFGGIPCLSVVGYFLCGFNPLGAVMFGVFTALSFSYFGQDIYSYRHKELHGINEKLILDKFYTFWDYKCREQVVRDEIITGKRE
eukprot:TRINITY_DN220_c0_g3_i1.p1 TRINITY_DN220_c0_g3~~TRINITY_DN220_c0_g3_i1.p1  ORF type:complete len:285 (+),score=75.56 TRINITY_DN220_c0_g3_i1:77-856(+)